MTKKRQIELAEQYYPYTLRRSNRARNILLHVDLAGQVELVVPRRVSFIEAERFISAKRSWLQKQLAKTKQRAVVVPRYRFASGEKVPFLGKQLELVVHHEPARRRARIKQGKGQLTIVVSNQTAVRPALINWYRKQARTFVALYAKIFAEQLGVNIKNIVIGSYSSQWGSANKAGRLAYNWRLLLGPEAVAGYVVAHEVAHFKHADHGQRFWSTVAALEPGYKTERRWLRDHGHTLVLEPVLP